MKKKRIKITSLIVLFLIAFCGCKKVGGHGYKAKRSSGYEGRENRKTEISNKCSSECIHLWPNLSYIDCVNRCKNRENSSASSFSGSNNGDWFVSVKHLGDHNFNKPCEEHGPFRTHRECYNYFHNGGGRGARWELCGASCDTPIGRYCYQCSGKGSCYKSRPESCSGGGGFER